MRQALIVIDVQRCFDPPPWQIVAIADLASRLPTVATIERHDEEVTPFRAQLGWAPAPDDEALVPADRIFARWGSSVRSSAGSRRKPAAWRPAFGCSTPACDPPCCNG
jgi:nicotinamidase-related amidase